ncbi:MAG: hypothetical protein HY817_02785 [Candidatus Abawacabacteria bacterium]|nr:hypothetical protein [Candidatus Abawacabacteria bacterium]
MYSIEQRESTPLGEGAEQIKRHMNAILAEVKRLVLRDAAGANIAAIQPQKIFSGRLFRCFTMKDGTGTIQVFLETNCAQNDNANTHRAELIVTYHPTIPLTVSCLNQVTNEQPFHPNYIELRIHLFGADSDSRPWLMEIMCRGKQNVPEGIWRLIVQGGDDTVDDSIGQRYTISVASEPGLIDAMEDDTFIAKNDTVGSDKEVKAAVPLVTLVASQLFRQGEKLTEISTQEVQRRRLRQVVAKSA